MVVRYGACYPKGKPLVLLDYCESPSHSIFDHIQTRGTVFGADSFCNKRNATRAEYQRSYIQAFTIETAQNWTKTIRIKLHSKIRVERVYECRERGGGRRGGGLVLVPYSRGGIPKARPALALEPLGNSAQAVQSARVKLQEA